MITPNNPAMTVAISLDSKSEANLDKLSVQIEALLVELRQARSLPTWVPVRENETIWNMANRLRVAGGAIFLDMSELGEIEIQLPRNYTICRLEVQPNVEIRPPSEVRRATDAEANAWHAMTGE